MAQGTAKLPEVKGSNAGGRQPGLESWIFFVLQTLTFVSFAAP